MTDYIAPDWAENSAENTGSSPNGIQGSYSPSSVAPILREMRGAAKRNFVRSNPIYTTTGTGSAYVLTYIAGPASYAKGEIYRVWAHADCAANPQININTLGAKTILNSRGGALSAGAIKAGDPITIVFDGTSFRLISQSTNDVTLTGTTTFGGPAVFGGAFRIDTNATTLSIQRNNANAIDVEAFLTANSATKHSIDLNRYGGPVTINGQTAWHAGNDGVGSTLDADLLDGQQGSFYQNASNINAGTLADARLPTTMAGKSFTSRVDSTGGYSANANYSYRTVVGNYGSFIYQDTSDMYYMVTNSGDQYGVYNTLRPLRINLASGDVAIGHNLQVNGNATISGGTLYVGASGRLHSDGNVYGTAWGGYLNNWISANLAYKNGSTQNLSITGNARTLGRNGGDTPMQFNWSGQSGQPTWLWGGNDGSQMYVYNPANFSVNYATSAGSATNANYASTTDLTRIGAMTIGGVGTYVLLRTVTGGAMNPGDTRAGSAFQWASGITGSGTGSPPSGTYRAANLIIDSGSGTGSTGMFLRIS